jgi:hypothetical protein
MGGVEESHIIPFMLLLLDRILFKIRNKLCHKFSEVKKLSKVGMNCPAPPHKKIHILGNRKFLIKLSLSLSLSRMRARVLSLSRALSLARTRWKQQEATPGSNPLKFGNNQ